jgi:2-C-methyl-D-erythritol 4-phosphate cytidylyltransferase
MQVTAIIAAAGDGRRMASGVPKQFMEIGGVSLLQRSVNAFCQVPRITDIIVVTRADAVEEVSRTIAVAGRAMSVVAGGATRQESVAAAFDHVAPGSEYVMVHDAARPFITPSLIDRTLDAAIESGAAIAALPARDTVKQAASVEGRAFIARTIPREEIYLAQTPQAFRREILASAVQLGRDGAVATDESALAELAGNRIRLVDGDPLNFKVTTCTGSSRDVHCCWGACRFPVTWGRSVTPTRMSSVMSSPTRCSARRAPGISAGTIPTRARNGRTHPASRCSANPSGT